jgi:hypothetical protein
VGLRDLVAAPPDEAAVVDAVARAVGLDANRV